MKNIDYWETIRDEVRVCNGIKRMLDAGVNPNRMTISSDGQGSLPISVVMVNSLEWALDSPLPSEGSKGMCILKQKFL